MGLAFFLLFHALSLAFCLIATRATFHYLGKHQIQAKHRYLLLGFIRTRYVALFYVLCISILSLGSIVTSLLLSFS